MRAALLALFVAVHCAPQSPPCLPLVCPAPAGVNWLESDACAIYYQHVSDLGCEPPPCPFVGLPRVDSAAGMACLDMLTEAWSCDARALQSIADDCRVCAVQITSE